MNDNILELLNTCQDLLTVCQKLIIVERNRTSDQRRELEDKISKLSASDALKDIFK